MSDRMNRTVMTGDARSYEQLALRELEQPGAEYHQARALVYATLAIAAATEDHA